MATSKLQIAVGNLLDKAFPQYRIRENYRPPWLVSSNHTLLELDFYIEDLKIGFEIQGIQHFEFVPFFFKSEEDFVKRQQYDKEKRDLCIGAGVRLIEVCSLMDAIAIINQIVHNSTEMAVATKFTYPESSKTYLLYKRDKRIKDSPAYRYWKRQYSRYYLNQKKYNDSNKIDEMKKFYKKLMRFYEIGGDMKFNSRVPSFEFIYLDQGEQDALLEETQLLTNQLWEAAKKK